MNNDIKVSIILPIYNVEKYISECLDSILKQTHKNIEIILVDDGSPDDCGRIIDDYSAKDKRIKVIHQKNGGVSNAKNNGLKIASGEYITFIDPDDYVEPDYVEYLLKLVKENDSDIAVAENFFDNYNMQQVNKEEYRYVESEKALIDILKYRFSVGVCAKIFKSSFLKKNSIYFYEDIFMGEGFNFNVWSFSKTKKKISIGNKKVYFYRRDNNASATTNFRIDKWNNALLAIDRMSHNLPLDNENVKAAYEFATWRTKADAIILLRLSNKKNDYKDFYINNRKYCINNYKIPFKVNSSMKDKIRSICIVIAPWLLPILYKLRRRINKVDVKN